MRSAARLKMSYYPLPEGEGKKLRALLSCANQASVIDPCVGQGTALQLVTRDAPVRHYGVELDAERARIANANGIETIQGNAFEAVARPESFSLLYLNPPYDSEIGSIANRRMEAFFLEHTYRWLTMGGVLILVIPFERFHDCAGILASHLTQLAVLRMTDEESVKYRSSIWEDVDRRLSQLKDAQQMVVEDPEILRGTPVIRGTRIPVHDVASLVDAGTPVQEILEIYPSLTPSKIGLASIYARANPQRGRPRRRSFPGSLTVSVSKKRLRSSSIGD
ncbi:MAG TPA: DUF6094 domain-containing protein [Acidobacteriaceae bacterium]|jgi:uncharacterized protein (DUF433 family)|nr:DUF6094 domain-containing protein [Acidobacteriaceae bacterium]